MMPAVLEAETPIALLPFSRDHAGETVDDQTLISEDIAQHLLGYRAMEPSPIGTMIITSEQPGLEQHWTFQGSGEQIAAFKTGAVVRYLTTTPAHTSPAARPTRQGFAALLEKVREQLDLDKQPLARLMGFHRGRFYRDEDALSAMNEKEMALVRRAEFLAGLASENQSVASALVHEHTDVVADYLKNGDYLSTIRLFQETRRQLAAAARPNLTGLVSHYSDLVAETQQLFHQPGFAKAVELLVGLSPNAGQVEIGRAQAFVELDEGYRAVASSDVVPERWGFLLTFTSQQRREFREKAFELIRSGSFTTDQWAQFIDAESKTAWSSYSPIVIEEDDEPAFTENDVAVRHEGDSGLFDEDVETAGLFYDRRDRR